MAVLHELLLLFLCLLLTLSPCLAQFCSWDNYTDSDTTVDMRMCGLTKLSPAPTWLTAVETIVLSANNLHQFPNITALAGSLSQIQIEGNATVRAWFSRINDDLITPLVNLKSISITLSQLAVFPNLTMAGHCLINLQMVDCPVSFIPPEISISFTKLKDVMLYMLKLTNFPDIRNSGASLRSIAMPYNRITNIPIEVTAQMTGLNSFELSGNRISQFPDLTNSSATLRNLYIAKNILTDAPTSLTTPFTVLKDVDLSRNLLTQMPDFTNSASKLWYLRLNENSITDAPTSLTTPFTALRDVGLASNLLTQIPDFTNSASTLRILRIDGNQISALSARLLRPLVKLQTLYVNDNPITAFLHLPGLTKLTFLSVANTNITQLPALWPEDIGSMTLALGGSTLDLCSCRNLWIKKTQAMYNSLIFTEQMCGPGRPWSSYSMDWLRTDCVDDKQQKRVKSGLTEKASLSPQRGPTLLLHSYLPGSDRPTCTITCLHTASCVGFWLGPAGCVISAATPSDPITVPGVEDPVWTFYGINMI